jgi:hypothetical protein
MDKPCTSTRFSRRALPSTLAAIPVLPELLYPNAAKAQAPVAPLASSNDGARLLMLLHNDAEREYAYGPALGLMDTKVGTFTQALYDQAKRNSWPVISMKDRLETYLLVRVIVATGSPHKPTCSI